MTREHDFQVIVDSYLASKFVKDIFDPYIYNDPALHYTVKGINAAMWQRVVKVELQHLAATHSYLLIILVEKPSNNYIEFKFEALPAESRRVSNEPPLSNAELRQIREMLKGSHT